MLSPQQRAAAAAFRGSRWWEESLYEGRLYLSTPDAAAAAAEDGEGRGRGDGAAADVDVGVGSRGRMRRVLRAGGARAAQRRYSARWLVLSRLPSASPAAADDSVNRRQQEEEEEEQEEEEAAIMLSAYYSEEDFLAGAPVAVRTGCHSPASCVRVTTYTGTSQGLLRACFSSTPYCVVAQAAARC